MKKQFKNMLIIDGSYMLHRSLHQKSLDELCAKDGHKTGGIYQFLNSILHELKINRSYFPIVVFDDGLSKRRTSIDPYYKHANEREEATVVTSEVISDDYIEEYRKQRGHLSVLLLYLGIPVIRIPGYEGDDLITLISRISENSIIVTDDKDMIQLVSETISIRRPMAEQTIIYRNYLLDNNYESIKDFVIEKSIIGDPSDNIPSCCKGCSKGTVAGLRTLLKNCNFDLKTVSNGKKLKEKCSELGIKYRKAYLNFDIERYNKNVSLIDLSLVEDNTYVYDNIIASISNSKNETSYFKAMAEISKHDIIDIDIDYFISEVRKRFKIIS